MLCGNVACGACFGDVSDPRTQQDSVYTLVDDCLKLPEGKLISSKQKKSALKWLAALTGKGAAGAGSDAGAEDAANRRMEVIDIDDSGLLTLMHLETGAAAPVCPLALQCTGRPCLSLPSNSNVTRARHATRTSLACTYGRRRLSHSLRSANKRTRVRVRRMPALVPPSLTEKCAGDTLEAVKVADLSLLDELRKKFDAGDPVNVMVAPDGSCDALC